MKQQSESNLPIFLGATISQNFPSMPWGPKLFTEMTLGTLCTLTPRQAKVLSLGDCPYPNIEDTIVHLYFYSHFLPEDQIMFYHFNQTSTGKFSFLGFFFFFAHFFNQKALRICIHTRTHRPHTHIHIRTYTELSNYIVDV